MRPSTQSESLFESKHFRSQLRTIPLLNRLWIERSLTERSCDEDASLSPGGDRPILQQCRSDELREIHFDRNARRVYANGRLITLESNEYNLLCRFLAFQRRKSGALQDGLTRLVEHYHVECRN
jgi:hypothetical protein